MNTKKTDTGDEYSKLVHTVKPVASRFLIEKFTHWKEVFTQETRKDVEAELFHDNQRSLYLRILAGTLSETDTIRDTGYSFLERMPLMETSSTSSKVFDILLKGDDGTLLFGQFIPDQKLSFQRLKDTLEPKYENLLQHITEVREHYGKGGIEISLILTGRPRGRILRSLAIFNSKIHADDIGPLGIISLLPAEGLILGLSSSDAKASVIEGNEKRLPLPTILQHPGIDAGQNIFRLFEYCIIEKYYGVMLHKGVEQPKIMNLKEMRASVRGLLGGEASPQDLFREIIDMAEHHNLIEAHPDIKGQYRLICPGIDLPLVQKNLTRKYIEGEAMLRADQLARRKAVQEYRKRYPRIDGRY